MYLKAADPEAHAVISGGRLYPVREGIFEVPDELAASGQFDGFERAGDLPAGVAADLTRLGSVEHITEEPAPVMAHGGSLLTGEDPRDAQIQQLSEDLQAETAEKHALAEKVRELVDDAAKPFRVVADDVAHLVDVLVDQEARTVTVTAKEVPSVEPDPAGVATGDPEPEPVEAVDGLPKKPAARKPRTKKSATEA